MLLDRLSDRREVHQNHLEGKRCLCKVSKGWYLLLVNLVAIDVFFDIDSKLALSEFSALCKQIRHELLLLLGAKRTNIQNLRSLALWR